MTLREEIINLSEGFNSKEPLSKRKYPVIIDSLLNDIYKYRETHKLSEENFPNGIKYVLKTLFPSFDFDGYESSKEQAGNPTSKKEAKEALKKLNTNYFSKGEKDRYEVSKITKIKKHFNESRNSDYKAGISSAMSRFYGKNWLTDDYWLYN